MTKLEKLGQQYGMSAEEMMEESMCDGVSPSICMNDGCDYSTDMEPDQDRGWCDECNTNTVKSVLILTGCI